MIREKLGKRNLCYNNRHRQWGESLNTMDVDFMEYKNGKPVALIETKFGLIKDVDLNDEKFDALCSLADERIPVILCIYYPMDSDHRLIGVEREGTAVAHIQFVIIGINQLGRRLIPQRKRMSEKEYVEFLYKLRNETVPIDIQNKLCTNWIPVSIPTITHRPIDRDTV